MSQSVRTGLVCSRPVAILAILGAFALTSQAEATRPAAIIVEPKRDEAVPRRMEVVGKTMIPGQPIVLVRPEVAGGHWWVQPPAAMAQRGHFRSQVCFGNDRSRPGDRFQVAIVVVRTVEEVSFFRDKEHLAALPDALPRSEVITVQLDASRPAEAASAGTAAVAIRQPKAGDRVTQDAIVRGEHRGGHPVILVRSDDANEVWWVQGPVVHDDEHTFAAKVRFGNDRTAAGQKFRMVVLLLPSAKAAEDVPPGATFARLPDDLPHSAEIVVTLVRANSSTSADPTPQQP